MRKLLVFNHVSLDGYFVDANGAMSFAHKDNQNEEWNAFVEGNASGGGMLLFGRVTYELMASFWPTPFAAESMPVVAKQMNNLSKVFFSRTLDKSLWNNTKLMKGDLTNEIRNMKREPGEGMVILGSGSIVSQLAQHGLIDEYQSIVNLGALGKGRTMLDGVKESVPPAL